MTFPDPKATAARMLAAIEAFLDAPSVETWRALRDVVWLMRPPRDAGPAPYDERYEIRQADIERALYEIGQDIGERTPRGWGFLLLLASHGEGGATFYMSSIQRPDAIKLLEEFLAREKAKPSPNRAPGA